MDRADLNGIFVSGHWESQKDIDTWIFVFDKNNKVEINFSGYEEGGNFSGTYLIKGNQVIRVVS